MVTRPGLSVESVSRASSAEPVVRIVPVFDGMGIIEVQAAYEYPAHRHQQYEIILVDQGVYRCRLNEERLVLGRNDVLVIRPGDLHQDYCEPPLRYFGLAFHFDTRWYGEEPPGLLAESVGPSGQRFRAERRTFWPLIRAIQREGRKADAVASYVQDALLEQFFWNLVRAFPPESINQRFLDLSSESGFARQFSRLCRMNVSKPLSVAEMAAALHISESSLSHKCRAVLDDSPARLFLRARLERARALLAGSEMTVKEAAYCVGFDDPYQFSRAFKRMFGRSPSEV